MSTPGKPGLRRPPIQEETQDLYDSVYGYIRTYTNGRDYLDQMYAIFDNYQSYPEYIINVKEKPIPISKIPLNISSTNSHCCYKCLMSNKYSQQSIYNGPGYINFPTLPKLLLK